MADLVLIEQFTAQGSAADQDARDLVAALPEEGLASFDELLLRFNYRREMLSDNAAALTVRVLRLLQRPTPVGFAKLLAILDYLDINRNFTVDNGELGIAVEVLETFCKVDAPYDTISDGELDILLAILQHLDSDSDGRLIRSEVAELRDQLWNPGPFFEQQKRTNKQLRKLLGL